MMAETEELINQARTLGEAIAANPTVSAYMQAQAGLHKDKTSQKLLGDYRAAADRIRKLELEQKPIEPQDKRQLAEYEQAMASNDTLKNWMRAQADYVAIMNQINQAMEQPLAALREADG